MPEDALLLVFNTRWHAGGQSAKTGIIHEERLVGGSRLTNASPHHRPHTSPCHGEPKFDSSTERILRDPTQIQTPNKKENSSSRRRREALLSSTRCCLSFPLHFNKRRRNIAKPLRPDRQSFAYTSFSVFSPFSVLPSLRSLFSKHLGAWSLQKSWSSSHAANSR